MISEYEGNIPADIIKRELRHKIVDCIEPFVSFDFGDIGNGEKVYTATLYVAAGDRKHG